MSLWTGDIKATRGSTHRNKPKSPRSPNSNCYTWRPKMPEQYNWCCCTRLYNYSNFVHWLNKISDREKASIFSQQDLKFGHES
mmetsp:Transcript_5984/g.14841  ORF Transcript_5984/g.14841 Transcript_5984/m.14841 type:complete len:83 (+) Transcript_5984:1964-2212(+)